MRRSLVVPVAVIVAAAAIGFAVVRSNSGDEAKSAGPNIVVIMTDDQTLESMRVLPRVNAMVAAQGTTFTNYAISYPNCCPSRASYLTGQYAHNTGVLDNLPPHGGVAKLRDDETLPVWLQRAGYKTASVGKYLNGYGEDGDISAPPGWTRWFGLIDPTTYQYYNYDVSVDGERTSFGEGAENYQTDVLAEEVVRFIDEQAAGSDPFFVSFTPLAPHDQAPESLNGKAVGFSWPEPSPRYKGTMKGAQAPRTPSWNQEDLSGIPEDIRRDTPVDENFVDTHYQAELETLLSVDDAVADIFAALYANGVLDDTVVIFTSDNGYFHGEHRFLAGKFHLYEAAVHVPLMIRGGPFTPGSVVEQATANVDLAPTILDLAGVAPPDLELDGRSLVPLVGDPSVAADRGVLLENFRGGQKLKTWGIRTPDWKYLVNLSDEEELYDLETDPDEVTNLAKDPAHAEVRADLAARALALSRCSGASCEDSDASRDE